MLLPISADIILLSVTIYLLARFDGQLVKMAAKNFQQIQTFVMLPLLIFMQDALYTHFERVMNLPTMTLFT